MWLHKLFGRKRVPEIDPGEEPARHPAPLPRETTGVPTEMKKRLAAIDLPPAPIVKAPGFDPYNSGSFKKKDDAWVRVGRR
jgi:hypothetical protein